MKDSLIVLSGGLDSTTMLYEYQYRIGMAVSFHYGSNHNDRELEFAKLHCERLGIPHMVVRLPFIKQFFKSSLLEGADAIPIAENNKMQYVMLANHAGDHTIYPDCRPEFVEAMNNAIHFGTWNGVQLLTPYTHLTKAEIAAKGKELNLDYSETWSCYKGGEHHCGVCGTCRERKEALAQAGIEDKTIYDC